MNSETEIVAVETNQPIVDPMGKGERALLAKQKLLAKIAEANMMVRLPRAKEQYLYKLKEKAESYLGMDIAALELLDNESFALLEKEVERIAENETQREKFCGRAVMYATTVSIVSCGVLAYLFNPQFILVATVSVFGYIIGFVISDSSAKRFIKSREKYLALESEKQENDTP